MTKGTTNVRFINFLGENLMANGIKCVGHFKRDNSSASIEIIGDELAQAPKVFKIITNILCCKDRTQIALTNHFNKTAHFRQS